MASHHPLRVLFFCTEAGNEPVREWLKSLPKDERTIIGEDIKTVQFRWPLGMPLVRHLDGKLYEIRTNLPRRTSRILFFVHESVLIVAHGFFKKTRQTPDGDLNLAKKRMRDYLKAYE